MLIRSMTKPILFVFLKKLEYIQYNACLALTGAKRVTLTAKL